MRRFKPAVATQDQPCRPHHRPLRRQRPGADITLVEQDPPGSTVGFGLVFSERALDFLRRDDPDTHDLIVPAMETWRDLAIVWGTVRVLWRREVP